MHTYRNVKAYLDTMPGRFAFVFTPKHGSWLNMIESFFGKQTKQMLKGIRVSSKGELVTRINKYFDEVNEVLFQCSPSAIAGSFFLTLRLGISNGTDF